MYIKGCPYKQACEFCPLAMRGRIMFADALGHTGTELTLQWVIAGAERRGFANEWERDVFTFDARFRQLQGKSD